jgi:hypothetical protein
MRRFYETQSFLLHNSGLKSAVTILIVPTEL